MRIVSPSMLVIIVSEQKKKKELNLRTFNAPLFNFLIHFLPYGTRQIDYFIYLHGIIRGL